MDTRERTPDESPAPPSQSTGGGGGRIVDEDGPEGVIIFGGVRKPPLRPCYCGSRGYTAHVLTNECCPRNRIGSDEV